MEDSEITHKVITREELEKGLIDDVKKGMNMFGILPTNENFEYLSRARSRYAEYITDKETSGVRKFYRVGDVYFWDIIRKEGD